MELSAVVLWPVVSVNMKNQIILLLSDLCHHVVRSISAIITQFVCSSSEA